MPKPKINQKLISKLKTSERKEKSKGVMTSKYCRRNCLPMRTISSCIYYWCVYTVSIWHLPGQPLLQNYASSITPYCLFTLLLKQAIFVIALYNSVLYPIVFYVPYVSLFVFVISFIVDVLTDPNEEVEECYDFQG